LEPAGLAAADTIETRIKRCFHEGRAISRRSREAHIAHFFEGRSYLPQEAVQRRNWRFNAQYWSALQFWRRIRVIGQLLRIERIV